MLPPRPLAPPPPQHPPTTPQAPDHLAPGRLPDDRRPQRLPRLHRVAQAAAVRPSFAPPRHVLPSRAAETDPSSALSCPTRSVTDDFSNLKMIGHVYIVEDAKDLAQIVRDATRYGGTFRPEECVFQRHLERGRKLTRPTRLTACMSSSSVAQTGRRLSARSCVRLTCPACLPSPGVADPYHPSLRPPQDSAMYSLSIKEDCVIC